MKLEATHLHKRFGGITATNDVSLTVETGRILGLIGPNGAGKSTLINLITGVNKLDGGDITVDDRSIAKLPPHKRVSAGVVRTFQNVRIFEGMSVRDNVELGQYPAYPFHARTILGRYLNQRERTVRIRTNEVLDQLGLTSWAARDAGSLPLGIQRRVEIARAIASGAKILLLDEPTSGMPSVEASEVALSLRALADTGIGILLIEHNMNVVFPISDDVCVLNFGSLIAQDRPSVIQRSPEVEEAYLGRVEDNDD
jgi:ABC-type branched-subunit amino acid transport system ATPase component